MTLPTGTISMAQVNSELGRSATQSINLNDGSVRQLAGKGSGAISMNDLRGKSNTPTFSPNPGTYTNNSVTPNAAYTINCSMAVTWNSSNNGVGYTSVSVANGGSASAFTMTCNSGRDQQRSATFNVTASYAGVNYSWTINLSSIGITIT